MLAHVVFKCLFLLCGGDLIGVETTKWGLFEAAYWKQGYRWRWRVEHLPEMISEASFALLDRRGCDDCVWTIFPLSKVVDGTPGSVVATVVPCELNLANGLSHECLNRCLVHCGALSTCRRAGVAVLEPLACLLSSQGVTQLQRLQLCRKSRPTRQCLEMA